MTVLTGTIQKRRGTAAEWLLSNPTLLEGEEGYESDTGKTKMGDGVTPWSGLPYNGTAQQQTGLVSGGAVSTGVFGGNNVRVAPAVWYIFGFGSFSTVVNSDFNVALSVAGNVRYVDFYGDASNVITKVEGVEGATASHPAAPADSALINSILVTDGAIAPAPPDLSNYATKIYADNSAATAETNAKSYVDNLSGAVNGYAPLGVDIKIPLAYLPNISITDTFVVVSQAAMLALAVEKGDVAVRSDLNKTFILAGTDPTILGNWQELLTPTDTVLSVNGQIGAVTISTTPGYLFYGATTTGYPTGSSALTFDGTTLTANGVNIGLSAGDATIQSTSVDNIVFKSSAATVALTMTNSTGNMTLTGSTIRLNGSDNRVTNKMYFGSLAVAPTAYGHYGPATTSISQMRLDLSGNAPTSGNILAGNIYGITDKLFFTITTGTSVKELAIWDETPSASGVIPYTTTNGRLKNSGMSWNVSQMQIGNAQYGSNFLIIYSSGAPAGSIALYTYGNSASSSFSNVFGNGVSEIQTNAGSGLIVGTTISKPLGFGTNNVLRGEFTTDGNFGFGGLGSYGSGVIVMFVKNATTVPTANPTGGGILYAEGGALKWRGSGGTVTTIANA